VRGLGVTEGESEGTVDDHCLICCKASCGWQYYTDVNNSRVLNIHDFEVRVHASILFSLLSLSSTCPAPVSAPPFRLKHPPCSHLTLIRLHPLSPQPPTASARILWPHSACSPRTRLFFFVIGTFAALKKPIVYTNCAQISLGTKWWWWWRTGRGVVCEEGHPVVSSGNG
jgi:hypothetical protein